MVAQKNSNGTRTIGSKTFLGTLDCKTTDGDSHGLFHGNLKHLLCKTENKINSPEASERTAAVNKTEPTGSNDTAALNTNRSIFQD
jgi:hypothetical protein